MVLLTTTSKECSNELYSEVSISDVTSPASAGFHFQESPTGYPPQPSEHL